MKLKEILTKIKTEFEIKGDENIEIKDVFLDSRLVEKGAIFFALDGKNFKGIDFAKNAVENGAIAVVAKDFVAGATSIKTHDVFAFLIEFLQEFYQNLPQNICAITGTNGKTSVAEFYRQICELIGKKAASIGTLGVGCDDEIKKELCLSDLTTPDIACLYKNLATLKKHGVDDIALEASSIGLEQNRIAGLKIQAASFTNFSVDHLDYHENMEKYFSCKMILFEKILQKNGFAVLNSDVCEFAKIKEICQKRGVKIFDYGFRAEFLKIISIKEKNFSQEILFEILGKKHVAEIAILGQFQVYNLLCALAMIFVKHDLSHEKLQEILPKFSKLKTALGRMQQVAVLKNKAQVFIDFAHSPDALENVLQMAKVMEYHRLGVLFGCGGNRDATKRPKMGEVAGRLADFVIVTDDNPRKEDAPAIRSEILKGCNMAKTIEIADRKYAIEKSLQMLQMRDIIIIAGKGHEKYQIIGDEKKQFDEEKIIKEFVKKEDL